MPTTVAGLFDRFLLAEDATDELQKAGFEKDNISIVAADAPAPREDELQSAAAIESGAALGGTAGLLLGLAALVIPGVGPIVAAGPLAAALGSAGVGAATGGLMGALASANFPENDAHYYAEAVRSGGALVTVKTSPDRAVLAREVLARAGARERPS